MATGTGSEVSERLQFAADAEASPEMPSVPDLWTGIGRVGYPPTSRGLDRRTIVSSFPILARRRILSALEMEWERGTAFHFIPVLLAAGAIAYFALDHEPGWSPLLLSTGLISALTFIARRNLVAFLALTAAVCVLLGLVFAKLETARANTKVLGSPVTTRLTARVTVIEHMANGRVRLSLEVIKTEQPALKYAPDRVRASARTVPSDLRAGDVVSGVVRLMPPSGPLQPGGYDFSFESYFDGLGANGFFFKDPVKIAGAPPGPASRLWSAVENARAALAARIESHIDGEAEGEIAAALVAGVRAGIPEDVNEALRATGLAHVLSISGLHMALVSLTIMLLIRGGLAFFPDLVSRHAVKKYAAGIALVALAVYLFISGSAVAAERSFIMIAVMLAALLVDRSALTMRNLAISGIAIIAVSPHEVVGPSFQMSFAATAALIAAYGWWSERRRTSAKTVLPARGMARTAGVAGLRFLGGLASTSLIAGTATALFGAYHFHRVTTLGLAANLVAMPIVSFVVMPFAVFGMIAMPFGLDGIFFWAMGEGLAWMLAIAEWFAAHSPIDTVGSIPVSAVATLTMALVLATLLTTWLRLAAVPCAILGIALLFTRVTPDILISEDARLVAVDTGSALAVNRARPSSFTMENWRSSMDRDAVAKPEILANPTPIPATDLAARFACHDGICAARTRSGHLVVHAPTAEQAWPYCATADVIVIDDATARASCRTHAVLVVTKQDLALMGSATITMSAHGTPAIAYAIGSGNRPWHDQRKFSREARGLPPSVPKARQSDRQSSNDGSSEDKSAYDEPADDKAAEAPVQ